MESLGMICPEDKVDKQIDGTLPKIVVHMQLHNDHPKNTNRDTANKLQCLRLYLPELRLWDPLVKQKASLAS